MIEVTGIDGRIYRVTRRLWRRIPQGRTMVIADEALDWAEPMLWWGGFPLAIEVILIAALAILVAVGWVALQLLVVLGLVFVVVNVVLARRFIVEARAVKLPIWSRVQQEPVAAPLYPRRLWRVHGWRRAQRVVEVVARELELRPIAEIDPYEALEELNDRD